jgi:hypothetical protein
MIHSESVILQELERASESLAQVQQFWTTTQRSGQGESP